MKQNKFKFTPEFFEKTLIVKIGNSKIRVNPKHIWIEQYEALKSQHRQNSNKIIKRKK